MSDIFKYRRNTKPTSVFSTQESTLTFGSGEALVGKLVQNWSTQYQQQVQELFEIGSSAIYWVKGRPTGSGSIGRIVGEAGAGTSMFPDKAFDICEGGAMFNISAKSGTCGNTQAKGVRLNLDGVVITSIGYQMSANDTRLNENIGFRFATLAVT